jgi:hypothetical protein
MLLSEARPRPYRTTTSEREGKFSNVFDRLDVAYKRYHMNDKAALQSHNWKDFSTRKRGRQYILMRELIKTYQDREGDDFIKLYDTSTNNGLTTSVAFYYTIETLISSKVWKKFNKYFNTATAGIPLNNLFPELNDIFDRGSKLFVQDRDFQGYTIIRIILGFINYDKFDFNMQMSARLRQLDAIIEKILSRVSERELEARAYKALSNMLKAAASAPDVSDDDEDDD